MNVQDISQIHDWKGKTVIVRAGMDVPVDSQGVITDDFRLERVLPTIHLMQAQEAKIVLIAHIGRDKEESLAPIARYLAQHIDIVFKEHFFLTNTSESIQNLKQEINHAPVGTVWLLDNLRASEAEKNNSEELARQLAEIADVYVNEAFSVSHRKHMSMWALPKQMPQAVVGLSCMQEVEQLSLALDPPPQSVAVISGNKFATKLPLIKNMLKSYDTLVVGGALANTLYYMKGYHIGKSLFESDLDQETREDLEGIITNPALYLPAIVVCGKGGGEKIAKHISEVEEDDYIYDIAPEGLLDLEETISKAGLVVWNGPLGYYEGGYSEGTERLLELVASSRTQSIVGGGNTVEVARNLGFEQDISFLSTGGGAMINFLSERTLPALDVLHTDK